MANIQPAAVRKKANPDGSLNADEREALLDRVRGYERAAAERVEKLRVRLARAEDFAATLRTRLGQDPPGVSS
ncbi:hypothetical protein GCM10010361_10070 [Streptomyces olivaceiscleroticus]|uniref:Transposase n=1 Tax=Streptomyces olivaceiscleroticus TaxID=68245 RepID=A0ABP3JBK1_9ACTN